ncbi:phosphoethanolamine transferase [Shewanella hanedai]|uniref:Phosphoethanolamine--lipid A transferase n=1 Tax=Shewanella hanedai TaxID=25 RepID=A0A553JIE1_SHEHA|nr:phosphoethanolamine--lipid A transferase [Shewanella hanedai]TRY12210.1 phosphoethanolamine--lipid A transferase [Shewanella hanedai]GGJ00095.1 phosphoethanolamine transferase [Shewanella hanedai]
MFFRLKKLSVNQFTLFIAIFYVCIFNIPFFQVVQQGIEKQTEVNPIFIATIPLFLIFALSFLFSLFSFKYLLKPFFISITLLSSSVFFAALQYGVVFDTGMIENTVQTNQAEAFTYLNLSSAVNFLLTGIIPAFLILKANIEYKPVIKEVIHKLGFMLCMLVGIGVIAFFYYQNYVSFGRNNDELKRLVVPTYVIGSIAKYTNQHYFQTPLVYQQQGLDAVNTHTARNGKGNLMVLVVGETARAKNYEYYGYQKPTNTYTKEHKVTAFQNMTSCGTATAVSVPCMFSNMTRAQYNARKAEAQDGVLDVLAHADIQQVWLDNDSGCKGVCDRITNITIERDSDPELCNGDYCFDQVLLNQLDKTLANIEHRDTLIVLHVIGSHGPTYYLRYPESNKKFTPDCPRSDIQNCSDEALVNTYDNTILYTDYILASVIDKLKGLDGQYNTGMIYMSDHGESLGEKGLYLHGAPYAIAPDEQTRIPMLTWFSPAFSQENKLDQSCLNKKAKRGGFSHDNLFDSLLGIMNVKTTVYDEGLDIFASCRAKT